MPIFEGDFARMNLVFLKDSYVGRDELMVEHVQVRLFV